MERGDLLKDMTVFVSVSVGRLATGGGEDEDGGTEFFLVESM